MGCVHCKEKVAGKGQAGSSGGPSLPPPLQYDPDPAQLGGAFTHIPDFNNFHGPAVPTPAPFYPSNTLQAHGSSITGQWRAGEGGAWGGSWLHPWVLAGTGLAHGALRVPQGGA